MNKTLCATLAAVLAASLSACGSSADGDSLTRLENAYYDCLTAADPASPAFDDDFLANVSVGDGGDSLIIDGVSDASGLGCLLGTLDVSEATIAQMDATNAMMGRQSAEENGLTINWSYHPDSGFDMTIAE